MTKSTAYAIGVPVCQIMAIGILACNTGTSNTTAIANATIRQTRPMRTKARREKRRTRRGRMNAARVDCHHTSTNGTTPSATALTSDSSNDLDPKHRAKIARHTTYTGNGGSNLALNARRAWRTSANVPA